MLANCGCSNLSKCGGCACCILKNLAQQISSQCNSSLNPSLFLLNKGTREPIRLISGEGDNSTVFQLLKFDPDSCCAYFTYVDNLGVTRTFIIDCRDISFIAMGPPGMNGNMA
ncbi:hypothetical protein [Fictibacillus phosphorivorans]|uniref:hypothetical protein n=1 Tax=Fictibacillus phosphorivorans TaxID=1221500 RepID=UPI0011A868CD|nr:hypothetical protein [Fictibacillus phosphorivorans]